MPSPFPGMDPFIEDQSWRDFHVSMLVEASCALVPRLRPKYVSEIDDFVYDMTRSPVRTETVYPSRRARERAGAPAVLELPLPDEITEHYLVIRNRESHEIVTVIELLSPTNKRPGSGRNQYLAKRENLFEAQDTHLVEIDLLRGGERMPTAEPLPTGDFYAFVCRTERHRLADVYAWSLRDRLPTIPIPLKNGDPDVPLDLQAVFDAVYDRSGYDYALDYGREIVPPLPEELRAWARECLDQRNS